MARCLSVCLSHAGILSKRLYISSTFFTNVAHHSSGSVLNGMAIFLRGPPLRERRVQVVYKKHDFRLISRFISEMMQDRATVTM